jgi:predicted permease
MLNDIRYASRMLLKSPGFTCIAVLSLAIGIGANTAIFSLMDAILLRQPPVEDPDQLVGLHTYNPKSPYGNPYSWTFFGDYLYYRDHNDVFSGLIAFAQYREVPMRLGDQVESVRAELVSGNYFSVLGVKAFLGRTFLPEEDRSPDTHPVVVLSHDLWQRRLSSNRNVIGQQLILNGHSFIVVGIAPKGFKGMSLYWSPEIWVPAMMHAQVTPTRSRIKSLNERESYIYLQWFMVMGRLKPGVTLEQAQAAMKVLASQLEQAYPKTNRGISVVLQRGARLGPTWRPKVIRTTGILLVLVGLVLLIACANVATLQLTRARVRQREIAVRLALGAARKRLVRQFLTESFVLSLLSAAVGLLIAKGMISFLLTFERLFEISIASDLRLDGRVVGFTLLLSLVTAILFGLAPALQASKPDLVRELKEGGTASGYRQSLGSNGLVVLQISLSAVLLVAAGLFVRDVQKIWAIDPGFKAENILLISFDLYALGYSESKALQFYKQLVEQVKAIPGVTSVSLALNVLPSFSEARAIVAREELGGQEKIVVSINYVLSGYFQLMGIPLLQGRDFLPKDDQHGPRVVVINETAAQRFWPGQNPLGKRLKLHEDTSDYEVVGVTRDAKYKELWEGPRPYLFFPCTQNYASQATLHVKTSLECSSLTGAVRREVQKLDRDVPILEIRTLQDHLRTQTSQPRMNALLSGLLGIVALILATFGLYGTVAYSVNQRTREFGIRMALGAKSEDVLKLVLKHGLSQVLIGLGIGIPASFILRRAVAGQLHVATTTDPLTLVCVPLLLSGVALLACYVPARRATKVDPMVALRYE